MENQKKEPQDTTKTNEQKDMPIKTVGTDPTKNTAGESGLNQDKTENNNMEPGMNEADPKSWETD